MAGKTSVNVSDLVLLTGAVITQEHNLRMCLSLCGIKLINFLARCKWFSAFEDAICHYFHALIRNKVRYSSHKGFGSLLCANSASASFGDREMLGIFVEPSITNHAPKLKRI